MTKKGETSPSNDCIAVKVKRAKWLPHLSQVNQTDPERIAWSRTKGWKRGFLCVKDENSKRNICSYCSSKTYCHLGNRNGGRSTKSWHCNNPILHSAHHLPHEWHTSHVCHLKPWFQYRALCEAPAVSLEKCTHENTGHYIKVNTYTRNNHNSHSQTTQRSVTLMWTLSCYYSNEHI